MSLRQHTGPLRSIPLKVKILTIVAAASLFAGLGWFFYQQATFLRGVDAENETDPLSQDVSILPDSLTYRDYTIVKTLDPQDSTYGVAIFRNKERVWTSRERTFRPEYNEVKLVSLRKDGTKQLYVRHFSGGPHCCWTSVLLELSDQVHPLFNSDDYADLGRELSISDLDDDGMAELHQPITTFDDFDKLSHSLSPFSSAYFSYSPPAGTFVLANRKFSAFILKNIPESERRVGAMADTTNFVRFEDLQGGYLAAVLRVLIDYVFAGEKEKGWKFYDTWYRLADKAGMRQKIQETFEASNIYQELYPD